MLDAKLAVVRPRVISPTTGESLLLEAVVTDPANINRGRAVQLCNASGAVLGQFPARFKPIQIVGGPGSGKTTALRHIIAVLPTTEVRAANDVVFLDEPEKIVHDHGRGLLIFTARAPILHSRDWLTLHLAPWDEDDLLEYLLARHRSRCAAILTAIRQADDAAHLHGNPELWTLTLDYLANKLPELEAMSAAEFSTPDPQASGSVAAALRDAYLEVLDDTPTLCSRARRISLELVVSHTSPPQELLDSLNSVSPWLRLLRHSVLREVLAADQIARDLTDGEACDYLRMRLPRAMVSMVAEQVRGITAARARLAAMLTSPPAERQPMAASICHALDRRCLPELFQSKAGKLPAMNQAYLSHAEWPGADLSMANIDRADLSFADLSGVNLEQAKGTQANFHGAMLARASMREFMGAEANFTQADLRSIKAVAAKFAQASFRKARLDEASLHRAHLLGADFTAASLVDASLRQAQGENAKFDEADCTGADFTQAILPGIDFRKASLDRTCWQRAHLAGCNFEDVEINEADFEEADLTGALLTGSRMPGGKFFGAKFVNAGLAEIDWERADLRHADLRGASFHLGSSRSGLVGSPIALEGSMTGFYTDEYTEQSFKAPEEIRKANLRGVDLRGAIIDGVDFYLVDLRDALYDAAQAEHFRACRALLESREPEE